MSVDEMYVKWNFHVPLMVVIIVIVCNKYTFVSGGG